MADRSNWRARKYKLGEEPEVDEEVLAMTPGERIEMCWQLTVNGWLIHDAAALRSRLRRDVGRIVRRGR
jgi:hypothetical protein